MRNFLRSTPTLFTLLLTFLGELSLFADSCTDRIADFYLGTSAIEAAEIPDHAKVAPHGINSVLYGGKLNAFRGPMEEIVSPVPILRGQDVIYLPLGTAPLMNAEEALASAGAASKASNNRRGAWAKMTISERLVYIRKFRDKMASLRARVVPMLAAEIAKTWFGGAEGDAAKEFDRTIEYIDKTIAAALALEKTFQELETRDGFDGLFSRIPYGTVLAMGPYNYPLNETFTMLIPAILTGNTVIVKPAKYGILFMDILVEAFRELPDGVVNFVYGDGRTVITPIMEAGLPDFFSFIGSEGTASSILAKHPRGLLLPKYLGLGATNPAVVLSDADIDLVVAQLLAGGFSYSAQRCTALKKWLIHQNIWPKLKRRLIEAIDALIVGHYFQKGTQITAFPNPREVMRMLELGKNAFRHGGELLNPRGMNHQNGFFAPTVIMGMNPQMRLYREEPFGPLVAAMLFDDPEVVYDYVATGSHHQQISLFGKDPQRLGRYWNELRLQASRVNLNWQSQRSPDEWPFAAFGDSGVGLLSVLGALLTYSNVSVLAARLKAPESEIKAMIATQASKHLIAPQ